MDLSNVSVLSLSRANNFFDSDFRFGANTSYSIEGYLLDLQNDIGVSGILQSSEFFRTGLQDYQDISINGDNFGKGRVTNFNVNESNFVKSTTYTVDIEGFESGNLHNLSGEYYDGLNTLTGFIQASHLLEDFSENFDFNRTDDSYSYNHNVSIKYASGDNIIISPIDRAKLLATYILTGSNPSFGFIDSQTSGLYTGNYKEYFNESYDAINNTVNISKSFNSLNPSGDYSISLKHSFDRDDNGISNVTENASLKAHEAPKKTALNTAFTTELGKAFSRCSAIYDFYQNDAFLNSSPLILGQNRNNFEGIGDYTVTYTNDPAFNNNYTWRYTHQIDKNGTFYTVSEDGDIVGLGGKRDVKYTNAKNAYSTIKGGIAGRVDTFYNSSVDSPSTLNLITKTENKNQFNGSISYSQEYSDEPSLAVDGLKRLEVSIEDSEPIDFYNTFEILGYKELAQSINTTTLGQRNLSMNLIGYREATLNSILTVADNRVNDYIPIGNDVFVSNANYSFNQNEKQCNLSVTWNYNRENGLGETL